VSVNLLIVTALCFKTTLYGYEFNTECIGNTGMDTIILIMRLEQVPQCARGLGIHKTPASHHHIQQRTGA